MPINYNANGSLKTVNEIKMNVGGTLRNVTEVWENVNGAMKLVWTATTGYANGVFGGPLANGLISGVAYFEGLDSPKMLYYNYNGDKTANKRLTSGTPTIILNMNSTSTYYWRVGWRSYSTIDLSKYNTIKFSIQGTGYINLYGVSFINADGTRHGEFYDKTVSVNAQWTSSTSNTGTFDISSYKESCYVVFFVRVNLKTSMSWACNLTVTNIEFN